ncbi:MAG: carbon-nitrogen family hydrolase [Lawsonibacter sp.]|jgi:predicted amidohydrolase
MRFASIQLASQEGETRQVRMERASSYLEQLCAQPERPVQVILPEIWATGFFDFEHYYAQAECDRGETYDLMSSWARKLGCYIHTGSFVEKDGESYYNTSLLLAPNGSVIGKYRKMHLFGYRSKEAELLSGGSQVGVFDTEYGRVGLATCYDLRFPELFRIMVNLGAEYFLVNSAWPINRLAHWRLFNQARAVEDQCFLISCNGVGTLNGSQLGGHSMILDPWGEILAEGGTEETVLQADVDPARIVDNREHFSALRDKKLC